MCAAVVVTNHQEAVGRTGPPLGVCPSLLDPSGQNSRFATVPPQCLTDLHLDAIIAATAPDEFQRTVWYTPLADLAVLEYRQDVAEELQRREFRDLAELLAGALRRARLSIGAAEQEYYKLPAELNLAEAISRFTTAVSEAARRLGELSPRSAGLRHLAAHLAAYVRDASFAELADANAAILARVRGHVFELGIQGGTVWAGPDTGRGPWEDRLRETFGRFSDSRAEEQAAVPPRPRRYLNHIEAQSIGLVAGLFPESFQQLHAFVTAHADFLSADLERLGEELRFYLGFLSVADDLGRTGVGWCVPRVLAGPDGPLQVSGLVDLALALDAKSGAELVPNDLHLGADERIAFITGPNQGGKTTFARAAGQLAYVASLGLLVPARSASLPLSNTVLTHFPRPDDPAHDRGGLADEIHRLHDVMVAADGHSLLVFNELFSATSAEDALQLSALLLEQITALGCRVLWVTFLEDLVNSVDGAASLVGQVEPDDPTKPTFRFRAQPPSGRSHAVALAARHGLSSEDLEGRLR
jgi:hypothetical protein